MSASVTAPVPFDISIHDPKPQLRELHLSFSPVFQQMSVEQRLESLRVYIESLLKQAKSTSDTGAQRGMMIVIEVTEQLLPHIQSDAVPLNEILIVEMGEGADGTSLNELLS